MINKKTQINDISILSFSQLPEKNQNRRKVEKTKCFTSQKIISKTCSTRFLKVRDFDARNYYFADRHQTLYLNNRTETY